MSEPAAFTAIDIPITDLRPLHERPISHKDLKRLLTSIKKVGLIEPLCVYKEEDGYTILDGYLRYLALLEFRVETVPCIVCDRKEAYTFNRMVVPVSPQQERRMVRRVLEEVPKEAIRNALNLTPADYRFGVNLEERLHPDLTKAMVDARLTPTCAGMIARANHEQQLEIWSDMNKVGDFTSAYVRIRLAELGVTPPNVAVVALRRVKRCQPGTAENQELREIDRQYGFYSNLYRQYVVDYTRLTGYMRRLLTNSRICEFLKARLPQEYQAMRAIAFEGIPHMLSDPQEEAPASSEGPSVPSEKTNPD